MKNVYWLIAALFLAGCSPLEMGRTVWGSSIRALDEARGDAFKKVYGCEFDACFDAVLSLDRKNSPKKEIKDNYVVFLQDRVRSVIIVMGVVGQVDTTEVGIFFTRLEDDKYRVEISSLSTTAKEKVAFLVFSELSKHFNEVLSEE